jgi:hypothetical protein
MIDIEAAALDDQASRVGGDAIPTTMQVSKSGLSFRRSRSRLAMTAVILGHFTLNGVTRSRPHRKRCRSSALWHYKCIANLQDYA